MKMSLMSKLSMSIVLMGVALNATAIPDHKLLVKYVKRTIVKNPEVTVKGVTVLESKTNPKLPGWTILLTTMDLEFQKKLLHVPEMMFAKDGLITGHLVDLKTGNDYRDEIKPTVPSSYYDNGHLLVGNQNATHKILVFSDPQCPFCQEVVPGIIKAAKADPQRFVVYYYHLPLLRLHPVSDMLTRVMHVAQSEGRSDVVEKIYSLKIDPEETDIKTILAAVKAHTGYVANEAKVNDPKVRAAMQADEDAAAKMMVAGTPTVYIDGEWDKMRDGYKKLIK
ncbi:MAG: hypothetical protein RLZZ428_324 [Pseudomonadota bacterium]